MKLALFALALTTSGAAIAQTVPPAPPAQPRMLSAMMMRADTDGDGAISRQEFIAQAGERFARMDRNNDGRLTAEEMGGRRRGARAGMTPPAPPQQ